VRQVPRHPADRADHYPDDVPADADPVAAEPDSGAKLFYLLNPFYYLVEIIRAPLEGRAPSLFVWTVVLAMTAAGFVVSLLFFSRFRNRVVYWL
jgi:ABC-type polysaccharide/polyol phosphate export permease